MLLASTMPMLAAPRWSPSVSTWGPTASLTRSPEKSRFAAGKMYNSPIVIATMKT